LALLIAPAARAQPLATRNARIYPVSGPVIENGTVLVESGRIRAVGADITVPAGAQVIDARGHVVMPGIVDANARFGLRGPANEQVSEVTPEARVLDLIDPHSPDLKRALQFGVTTACVTPGTANTIGGLCAVLKTAGETRQGMTLAGAAAVRAALGEDVPAGNSGFRTFGVSESLTSIYARRPNSRMAALWELRHALFQASRAPRLAAVLKGELPLRVHARIENDIRAALTLAEEFHVPRLILDECTEGYRVADLIASRRVPVVLGPFVDPHGPAREDEEACLNNAGILAARGVPVAFGSGGADPGELRSWAAFAVRYGLQPDAALRAITLQAASVAGVSARVGSLEPGKDADLLLLDGDPLDYRTFVEKTFVNGRLVYDKERSTFFSHVLRQRLQPPAGDEK
jgi:imidazolonepropionase-like amidohydrolase